MSKILVIIDVQNDYFPGGKFPLWNTEAVLQNTVQAMKMAHQQNIPIILVQHVADTTKASPGAFEKGTVGAEVHPAIRAAAPAAPLVVKHFADAFVNTDLAELLTQKDAKHLLVCGMMTQNCVTHTAISKSAEGYRVTLLPDCCTTVDETIHRLALNAISTRVTLMPSTEALCT